MNYTIFNLATGEIQQVITTSDESLAALNLQDKSYIEGIYDSKKYYIDNNQPIDKPVDPGNQIQFYNFDYATKQWTINIDKSNQQARQYRNGLLSIVDKINPVWYSTLTTEQKNDLSHYRQALLDVPQQADFPMTITWPTSPEWL